ncbi:conserved hypothetical protein [Leishmania infantum JPCM5]|uniref:Small acidic protein n=2 Tax=Leishmania infantum TaxID=5671 RepID=A0A6L0XS45_LEIIN|nr:conserved hypothetical protein [Leishmania infantum JPCM5]CAC9551250.1 Small_acidic_protein_family_-_putative [Leishmania infantum]CAM72779.1 conserved hypothetical protein [Leishmania infantum JPCM5]SUZ46743.1 Small_acidic_protein_family_-_putative [Leishmania infantum]|eukprot:XP_001469668.1 conserved hypothetical protein [Leishmania infantum JPCM5]
MTSFKDCLREVREAATEHLEGCRGGDTEKALQHIPREEALTTISLVAIRLLEQELQKRGACDDASQNELHSKLKACRKALKSHSARSAAGDEGTSDKKRRRTEDSTEEPTSSSSSRGTATADRSGTSKLIELGQYASSDAFDENEQKRMKFARLMGGAKVAAQEKGGAGGHSRHNTFAASNAELKRMNANLESQFESAMSHKGKKGLGA